MVSLREPIQERYVVSALGNLLREKMKEKGWEQKDLAAESGIPKATISRIVGGKVAEPELTTLWRLSDTLGEPLGKLIELAGFPVEPVTTDDDRRRRLALLVETFPWLELVVDDLAGLQPEDQAAVLSLLDGLRRRRQTA